MKKVLMVSLILLLACLVIFTGCQRRESASTTVLRIGDNYPDRSGGMGAVMDRINNEFIAANPNVRIEVESMQDQPWQDSVRIYATANRLPDIIKWWTFPNMMNPLINGGHLMRLNKNDFSGFNFLPGALESNEFGGNFYGIPVSGDMWVLYVNRALFQQAGVPIPTTWEEIFASVPRFRAQNITPLVTNGLEGWPLSIFYDAVVQRLNGDFNRTYNAITRTGNVRFTDPDFVQAAALIQDAVRAGVFNTNLTTSDYGDAQNQFIQGRAAMYMMGSWEMGMATNPSFPQSFRDSLDVIKFPIIQSGGRGTINEAMTWFGGNYVVAASANELAVQYMRFMAERIGPYAWEMGGGFPAQRVTPRADDSDVSKKLLQFSAEATAVSGRAPGLDYGITSVFKEEHQELMRQLCALIITPEVFAQRLDAAAAQDARQ